jgi:phenylpyruvate tautomerase PptA (4-oxalocrotonate tautomerase family)
VPIVSVEIVGSLDVPNLAQLIADGTVNVFGSAPQATWVKLRFVPTRDYAENGGAAVQPVFVNVVKAEPPQGDALREEASALARVVADACGRPSENVHVIYEPAGRDRVVFGGGD